MQDVQAGYASPEPVGSEGLNVSAGQRHHRCLRQAHSEACQDAHRNIERDSQQHGREATEQAGPDQELALDLFAADTCQKHRSNERTQAEAHHQVTKDRAVGRAQIFAGEDGHYGLKRHDERAVEGNQDYDESYRLAGVDVN